MAAAISTAAAEFVLIKVKRLYPATLPKQNSTIGVFSCECQEIFQNVFSVEDLRTATFVSKFIQN